MPKSVTIAELTKTLGSTVKHDDANKVITFLGMLLTYTEEDQINIGFLAESSTGKSYIPLEISQYFPAEDVMETGYASPTAFFHDYSNLRKGTKGKQRFLVDLHQKILIFMDQPHDQLLQRLRPILSHDKKVIPLMITDRNKNKNLRTKRIDIQGYPTVIFASARFGMSDQEKTRLLLLSPEASQEKLQESISLKITKESNREGFRESLKNDPARAELAQRVVEAKLAQIKQIMIPSELQKEIHKRFFSKHAKLAPRHQRDIGRLLALIKSHALLNFKLRENVHNCIEVTLEDVDAGFMLYEKVSEANELGLSPELFEILEKLKPYIKEYTKENFLGITIVDYQNFYEQSFYRKLNYDVARETLKTFVSLGLMKEDVDPGDRRTKRYLLFECVLKTEKSTQW
jgi:ribose 5-phosphate isomerase RpiB